MMNAPEKLPAIATPADALRFLAADLQLITTPGEIQKKIATRKASHIVLEYISSALPEFFGGSADLTGSNLTNVKASKWVNHHASGNYLSYGVREFGMAAMMNGMALYGGFIPYGGTFMTFSDYSRDAIRLAALSCDAFIDSFIEISDFLAPELEILPISQMQDQCAF